MVTSKPSLTNCPYTFLLQVYGWYIRLAFLHCQLVFFGFCHVNLIQVAIASGFHLFPFRTEKLNLITPMVLRNSGRVGSRQFQKSLRQSLLTDGDFLRAYNSGVRPRKQPLFACKKKKLRVLCKVISQFLLFLDKNGFSFEIIDKEQLILPFSTLFIACLLYFI